jgi:hypothetical protein
MLSEVLFGVAVAVDVAMMGGGLWLCVASLQDSQQVALSTAGM